MKISLSKLPLIVLFFICYTSCSTPQKNLTREPQNSVYEDVEVLAGSDLDSENDSEFEEDEGGDKGASRFERICKEPAWQEIRINDRVVTMVDGNYISGNVKAVYKNGTFVVFSDYGPKNISRKQLELTRSSKELSKAMQCQGMLSKKVYGLFVVKNKFYTGHVREVFKNGVVRFVSDKFEEQFTTIDQSYLEVRSNLRLKTVLFRPPRMRPDNRLVKGQIRRVFENDTFLIKYGEGLFLRKFDEVAIYE